MRVWNDLMEVNISNTMEINWWLGLVKTTSIHPTGMSSANAWRHHRQEDWLHPCVDTQQDVLYPIQCQTTNGVGRLGKAICEVLPQVSLLYVLWRHLRRGFVVDPFVLTVKLFSALHSSMLFFAVFLVLEFIDWIICRSQQRLTAGLTNSVRCKSVQGVRT